MLHFFARRIKESREDERGFTLIELLVVVIIIGILAAIAIPAFLSQRSRANNAAAQSDLRNAAASATSCSAANNGAYDSPSNCQDKAILASKFDLKSTDNVALNVTTAVADKATKWSATAKHSGGDTTYKYSTDSGKVEAVAPPPAP